MPHTDEEQEKRVFEEIAQEALQEVHEEKVSDGKMHGYLGIAIGALGLVLPAFFPVIAGFLAASLGAFANQQGNRTLGIISGTLALINLFGFFVFTGGRLQMW